MLTSIENLPINDSKTWELIASGKTNGVFQCESLLVQNWLSKIQPKNIWELSIVIAGVRPASLQSGAMDRYLKYKNDPSSIKKTGNETIDSILKSTNFNIFFQEQLILLAQRLAWKHLPELERLAKSDDLRKAVGKKDSAKILAIGKEFTDGCIANGVNQELADKLFNVLKNAGRYAFNLSHSISYAFVAYYTAYLKTHYPKQFFATYLSYSKEKIKPFYELNKMAQDAKRFGIKILPPNINKKNLEFSIENDNIRYGLSHIKFIDNKFRDNIKNLKEIKSIADFLNFIIKGYFVDNEYIKPNCRCVQSLIITGCFSDIGCSRNDLLNIANLIDSLTKKEQEGVITILDECKDINSVPSIISKVAQHVSVKKRRPIIDSESKFLEKSLNKDDTEYFIEKSEKEYCGTIITGNLLGDKEKFSTRKCLELNDYSGDDNQFLICVIDKVEIKVIKSGANKGKKMCTLSVHDSTGTLDNICIFSDIFANSSDIIREDSIIQLTLNNKNGRWITRGICTI
jgi:DNA polymerase III alpha subunit